MNVNNTALSTTSNYIYIKIMITRMKNKHYSDSGLELLEIKQVIMYCKHVVITNNI